MAGCACKFLLSRGQRIGKGVMERKKKYLSKFLTFRAGQGNFSHPKRLKCKKKGGKKQWKDRRHILLLSELE